MDFEKALDRLYMFDFEVTRYDWILVAIKYRTRERIIFHNDVRDKVQSWIDKNNPILLGHNACHYDKYILKAILAGCSVEEVKSTNDYIMSGNQGWEIDFGEYVELPPIWDTLQDVVPPKSLKEIEGNLGLDITESSVDFNIDHKLTDEEFKDMVKYCIADVEALFPLFEARRDYFETKYGICVESAIDPSSYTGKTNAKLVSIFLGAKKKNWNDKRDFQLPKCSVNLDNVPKKILDFYNQINDLSIPDDKIFGKKKKKGESRKKDEMGMSLIYNFDGVDIVFKLGGQHSARPNYSYDSDKQKGIVVINVDFGSLYPHLLALPQYNYISRNISDPNKYYKTLQDRLKYKKEGNHAKQKPLKLVLNGASGAQDQEVSDMYDPRNTINMRIFGQILLTELTMRVMKIKGCSLVQTNTDGLMVSLPEESLNEYYDICNDFSKECSIPIEYDIIKKIVQRDVNNYIVLMDNNDIKAKGGCFSALPELKYDNGDVIVTPVNDFKANSLSICAEAIAKNLLFGIPVEDTINNCNDLIRFQTINHLGGTYDKLILEKPNGDIIELQKNNRIYSSKEKTGIIYKVKPDGKKDSLPMCPVNPVIDNNNKFTIDKLNKIWYINYTKQKINDFKGERKVFMEEKLDKLKKDELIELVKDYKEKAENTTSVNTELSVEGKLYHKIQKLREFIRNTNFILDKALPNNLGGGEYVSIEQYYKAVQDGCMVVGLDFSFEIVNVDRFDLEAFRPVTGAPQNIATVSCIITLTDIDTGFRKKYEEMSQGSDSVDKAVNGASTLAFRNWFDKNFTPAKFNGKVVNFGDDDTNVALDGVNIPNSDKTEVRKPVFVPATKKEEIKQELVSNPQKSGNKKDIEELTSVIFKYRELSGNPEAGAKKLEAITTGEYTDADILSWKITFENAIDELNKVVNTSNKGE